MRIEIELDESGTIVPRTLGIHESLEQAMRALAAIGLAELLGDFASGRMPSTSEALERRCALLFRTYWEGIPEVEELAELLGTTEAKAKNVMKTVFARNRQSMTPLVQKEVLRAVGAAKPIDSANLQLHIVNPVVLEEVGRLIVSKCPELGRPRYAAQGSRYATLSKEAFDCLTRALQGAQVERPK